MSVDWSKVRHFKPGEFVKPELVSPTLVYKLDAVREISRVPMRLTSTCREESLRISAHEVERDGKYEAVDVAVNSSRERYLLVRAALEAGFTRIGVYDKHIHLDVATAPEGFPQEVLWVGESQ